MKVYDMDKYQLTEQMKKLKEYVIDPNTSIHGLTEEHYEEILNPPTDKDGYIHKFYLTDSTKIFLDIFADKISKI